MIVSIAKVSPAPKSVDVIKVPVLHPSVLVCLKIRRWRHIAESARPQSIVKAHSDARDIMFLLIWLSKSGQYVSFRGMDEQRKATLLQAFQLFAEKRLDSKGFIVSALESADLQTIDL